MTKTSSPDRACAACGASTPPGDVLCRKCVQEGIRLAGLIRLYESAYMAIMRREATRNTSPVAHVTRSEAPAPVNEHMLERLQAWRMELTDLLLAVRPYTVLPGDMRLATLAVRLWLSAGNSGVAVESLNTLRRIAEGLEHACDPAKPRVAFGLCPDCGGRVWGEADADYGECAQCGNRVHRQMVGDELAARIASDTRRGYPIDIHRMLAREGVRCPASTIRSWVNRGELVRDATGMIALADVAALLRRRATCPRSRR